MYDYSDYYDYYDYSSTPAFNPLPTIISLVLCVFVLVCMWIIFRKAGKPGWAAIVPFYNLYVLFDITWGSGMRFLLMLIPFFRRRVVRRLLWYFFVRVVSIFRRRPCSLCLTRLP